MIMEKAELVLVPSPGLGHLLSAVELAKRIVQRDQRISILVLVINLPFDSTMVNSYVDSKSRGSSDTTGRLTLVTLPPLSNPPDTSVSAYFQTFVEMQKPLVQHAVLDRVSSGSLKPVGFVLDMFCTSMIDVANHLGVPSYIFFTSGANLLNLMFHFQVMAHDKGVDITGEFSSNPDTELDAPGFRNRVPVKVLPWMFVDREGGSEMILNHARRYRECKGILVNTYMELETYAVQCLLDQAMSHEIPAVYPVGPILELDSKSRCGSHKEEEEDSVVTWLDEQPSSSVVFLCFGSMGCFNDDQVKEIATGLDRSGLRFLWSLRRLPLEGKYGPPNEEANIEALPEGFLDRTAHRGKIIGWAPQVSILAHKAVGGFVSHCGWNSTLESLWFGVPMATWPTHAEQQLNAFGLIKELGLAVEIRMDYRRDRRTREANYTVTAEEIEKGVKKLMSMGEEMKGRVKQVSDNGRKGLQHGGSSHDWLGRFIGNVLDNVALLP